MEIHRRPITQSKRPILKPIASGRVSRVTLDPSDCVSGISTCVKGGVAKSNLILFDPGAAGLKTLDSKDWLV